MGREQRKLMTSPTMNQQHRPGDGNPERGVTRRYHRRAGGCGVLASQNPTHVPGRDPQGTATLQGVQGARSPASLEEGHGRA